MNRIRESIINKQFDSFRKEFISKYKPADENARLNQSKLRNQK